MSVKSAKRNLNVDTLASYLINYDITKDSFNYNIKNETEKEQLKNYYDDRLNFARRMVTESEYVGNSLDNLEKINCLIKR